MPAGPFLCLRAILYLYLRALAQLSIVWLLYWTASPIDMPSRFSFNIAYHLVPQIRYHSTVYMNMPWSTYCILIVSQFWLTLVTYRSSQKETCPTAMLQSTMRREKYLVFAHGKVFAFFVRCLVLNPSTKSLKQLRFVFLLNPKPTQTQLYPFSLP